MIFYRSANKQKSKLLNTIKHQLVGEKLMWFKQNMFPDECQWSEFDLADLLIKYIGRNDEELEQIEIKRSIGRRGRQHASREDVILMTKKEEQTQFDTCGIEIPNLFNRKQREMLRDWDGDLKLLPNFKFRRFGRKHLTDAVNREMQRIEKDG
ncbi:translation machinery-associated protein 16 isoform X2 [Monomorium pharaonis]|uniref:translation machinery-associated protein 16 isoform X2 n=1 Tax=Monomorium pharaonis TaxID=307658 RepID=UPI00063F9492|nr:translation machinery-associated protein 16 isoform X2 [Monomorium pharaonis]